jgi:hypothetical protein
MGFPEEVVRLAKESEMAAVQIVSLLSHCPRTLAASFRIPHLKLFGIYSP